MIPILQSGHYRTYVGKPNDLGWNSSTHLAQIDFGDGRDTRAYAKVLMDNWPALANEALGWMLARALGMPHAPKAGILIMPRWQFIKDIGDPPEFASMGDDILLWCTAAMPHRSLKFLFRSQDAIDNAYATLLRSKSGRRIAALAAFTDNPDTASGNVLRINAEEYVGIDHEHLFNCHDWRLDKPIPELDIPTQLLRSLAEERKKRRMNAATYRTTCTEIAVCAERHADALAEIAPAAAPLLKDLTDEAASIRILAFLRARTGKDWLHHRLGLLPV
jgi:hypothetical protein